MLPRAGPEAHVFLACGPSQGAQGNTRACPAIRLHCFSLLFTGSSSTHPFSLLPPDPDPFSSQSHSAVVLCGPSIVMQKAWLVWPWPRALGEGRRGQTGLARRSGTGSEFPGPSWHSWTWGRGWGGYGASLQPLARVLLQPTQKEAAPQPGWWCTKG